MESFSFTEEGKLLKMTSGWVNEDLIYGWTLSGSLNDHQHSECAAILHVINMLNLLVWIRDVRHTHFQTVKLKNIS